MMQKLLVFLLSVFIAVGVSAQSSFRLRGRIHNLHKDTIRITVLDEPWANQVKTIRTPVIRGEFDVQLPVLRPMLVQVTDGSYYITGVVDSGAAIGIEYDANDPEHTLRISGTGQEGFLFMDRFTDADLTRKSNGFIVEAKQKEKPVEYFLSKTDSTEKYYLRQLEKLSYLFSPAVTTYLRGEILGTFLFKRFNGVTALDETITGRDAISLPAPHVQTYIRNYLVFDSTFNGSPTYNSNVATLLESDWQQKKNSQLLSDTTLYGFYSWCAAKIPYSMRSTVLAILISRKLQAIRKDPMQDEIIALSDLPNTRYNYNRDIRNKLMQLHIFSKGDAVPDFSLEDQRGNTVTLASLKGKVVYMDFWFATCAPCLNLFERIRTAKDHFKSYDRVVFLTISVDDYHTWKKALAKFSIGGYHVFTQNREREHPILKAYHVSGYPTTFIIGKNGLMAESNPAGTAEELIRQIERVLSE